MFSSSYPEWGNPANPGKEQSNDLKLLIEKGRGGFVFFFFFFHRLDSLINC